MFKGKKMLTFYFILMGIAFLVLCYATIVSNADRSNFLMGDVKLIDSNFEIAGEDNQFTEVNTNVKIPAKFDIDSSVFKVKFTLSDSYPEGYSLVVYAYDQFLNVYIDDECIVKYDYVEKGFSVPQREYIFIDLKEEYYGKDVILEYTTSLDSAKGQFNQVYLADEKDITKYILGQGVVPLLCSIWLIGLGVFLIILWVSIRFNNDNNVLLYIGIFAVFMSLWTAHECSIVELLIPNSLAKRIVVWQVLHLISVPAMFYIRECVDSKIIKTIYNIVIVIIMINWTSANVLYVLGIADYSRTIYLMLLSLMLSVLVPSAVGIIYSFVKKTESKKNQYLEELNTIGRIFLGATVTLDVANYFTKWYRDNNLLSRIGIMLYITIIAIESLMMLYNIMFVGQKAKMFKEIAQEDILTKVRSRSAYAEVMDNMISDKTFYENAGIVAFDVNDLKIMNDVHGHEAGDRYLTDCAQIITQTFENMGECYRTGGDEFIVIIKNFSKKRFAERISLMKKLVDDYHKESDRTMSMAYGYAMFEPSIDSNLYDTVKRADELMYKAKKERKEKKSLSE